MWLDPNKQVAPVAASSRRPTGLLATEQRSGALANESHGGKGRGFKGIMRRDVKLNKMMSCIMSPIPIARQLSGNCGETRMWKR